MFKFFIKNIKTTNDNIILATPLILFMWFLTLYLGYSKNSVNSTPLLILSIITILFMLGAFFSGWFYMVKKSIKFSKKIFVLDSDKSNATIALLKKFPTGIGKYFLSFIGVILLFTLILSIAGIVIFQVGIHAIGNLGLNADQIKSILTATIDIKPFLDSLTYEQLIKLNNWNLLILGSYSLLTFLLIFWIPEIIYNTKNPLFALFSSIKKVFKKILDTLKIFIFLSFINILLSFASTFCLVNPFVYFIIMLIYFYYIVYLVVLIFSYYDKEFK